MPRYKIYISLILLLFLTPMIVKAEAGAELGLNKTTALTLKIMTFNIHSGINWYGSFDLDGLINFIQATAPDIIGLQEVERFWSSMSAFSDIPEELAHRLNMYYAFSASRERNSGYFGNLILSKYPIIQVWTYSLPGSLEPRSFALVQVMVEGVRVNFLTTHLGLSVADRLQQTAKIMEFTNEITGPIIVTGDFNGDAKDPAVSILKQNFLDIQELTEIKGQGTFRSKDGKVNSKIDYILTTAEFGWNKIEIMDNYISDHLPVIAELTLEVSQQNITGEPVAIQPSFF